MKSTNATKVGYLVIAIAVFSASCSDNSPTSSQDPPPIRQTYPFTYARLSQDSLSVIKDLFHADNPRVCGTLNEFGLTGGASCFVHGKGVSPDFNPLLIEDEARDFLIRNSQFTGVTDNSDLKLTSLNEIPLENGDLKYVTLIFESQIVEGLPVHSQSTIYSSTIYVTMDSLCPIYILGNRLPDIIIPPTKTTPDDVKESLIGRKILGYDCGGRLRGFIIADDSFQANPMDSDSSIEFEKVIIPLNAERGMELRVAWRVVVVDSCGIGELIIWALYVDVSSGELIHTEQIGISLP